MDIDNHLKKSKANLINRGIKLTEIISSIDEQDNELTNDEKLALYSDIKSSVSRINKLLDEHENRRNSN
jgi:hypothetical protein